MGYVGLLFCSTVLLLYTPLLAEASSGQPPEFYIRITFSFAWRQFCYMSDLFKHSLSDLLIEQRDNLVFLVPVSRIKYVNVNTECVNSHTNTKKATVDFYIADTKSTNDVDRKMTELAFSLLYYYREAKRMILLGPIFETKVEKVELRGKEAHKTPKGLTEAEHIGAGIGVALVLVFLFVAIYSMMYYRDKLSKLKRKCVDASQTDVTSRRDSFTSKATSCSMNEMVECEDIEHITEIELNRPDTPEMHQEKTGMTSF